MMKILILLCLITTHTYAQNIVVETYCFNSTAESLKAQSSAKYMMLTSDRIESKNECFGLFTVEARRELIQRYLRQSYPSMAITYSSTERSVEEMCNLKVEKIKNSNQTQTKARIQALGEASIGQTISESKEVSQIKAMSGSPFTLEVETQKLSGTCRFINQSRYEIVFRMEFIPRPTTPPAPEGVIVIVQNPPPAEIQQGTSLSTTIQLNQGERIEIGSIVKDLTQKGHEASLIPKLSYEKTEGQSTEKIYLMIE